MIKKVLILGLLASLIISGTACTANFTSALDQFTTATGTTKDSVLEDKMIEIVVPEHIFADSSDEELRDIAGDKNFMSVTRNDDGSVTMKMSAHFHQTYIAALREKFDEIRQNLLNKEEFSYLKDISCFDDFSMIIVTVNRSAFEAAQADGRETAVLELGIASCDIFQPLMGIKVGSQIMVVDESTSETITMYLFPEASEDLLEAATSEALAGIGAIDIKG